ncbi:hypothetical protein A0H81_08428 [Grifola frondosa]|uniref:Methyltransferase type 11 domain-containing protein n=1 Tax=Grifola frondosa TaxID=5627 RepID=A0A1C7M4S1_GRIFR|nr:hypothetical protein A0H81_08428 [Grifola frondosa]
MVNTFADPTFDAEQYRIHRPRYPARLFKEILDAHLSSGGQTGVALDLGCGPGIATESLVPYFSKVIGVDPSEGMITAATRAATEIKGDLTYKVGAAEAIPVEDALVDLLTSGSAAVYFAPSWWNEATRVVKPGGTVALFGYSELFLSPRGIPNGEKAAEAIRSCWNSPELVSHSQFGGAAGMQIFDRLALPEQGNGMWGKAEKQVWNKGGVRGDEDVFMAQKITVAELKANLKTAGIYHRWREANKDKADTIEDPIGRMSAQLKEFSGLSDDSVVEIGWELVLIRLKRL